MPDVPSHSSSRPECCSVLVVDIVHFSGKDVDRQVTQRAVLLDCVHQARLSEPRADRIAIDAGDGVAIGFFGHPQEAYFAALAIRHRLRERLAVRLGIGYGPVRRTRDLSDRPTLIGTAINQAHVIMGFASPGTIFVSDGYRRSLVDLRAESAGWFRSLGMMRSKHGEALAVHVVAERGEAGPRAPTLDTVIRAGPVVGSGNAINSATLACALGYLLEEIGPIARIVVERARDGSGGRAAFVERIANALPDEQRRDRLRALLAETSGKASDPAKRWPPTEIELARIRLLVSTECGPVSEVLVRQALKRSTTAAEFRSELARRLPDEETRAAVLQAFDALTSP